MQLQNTGIFSCITVEGAKALERYTTGLLTELPDKYCDSLAQQFLGPASNACWRS
jgi:hypothetical protein